MSKKWWQSRTMWVNLLTLSAGVVGYVAGQDWIKDQASLVAVLVAVQGGLNVLLRLVTFKAIK